MPETLPLDGVSLAPLLKGEAFNDTGRMFFSHWRRNAGSQLTPGAVRTTRWRAVNTGEGWELYDMLNDPGEHTNVASLYPDIASDLASAYGNWFADVTQAGFEDMPTPVGYAERPEVELRGHEALLQPDIGDGISYLGRNGWSNDWVTNWTSLESYPSWPLNVVRGGQFEVSIHYTCAPENVGARFLIEVAGQNIEGLISEAYDPPYRFSPDRVLRGEVYEKTWKPLTVGTVTLTPGQTFLNVKALAMVGERMFDLKAVHLRRIGE